MRRSDHHSQQGSEIEQEGALQVKTGDSSSWTSLSIWMSMLTVISRSALIQSVMPVQHHVEEHTKLEADGMLAHMLGQEDTMRM